MLSYIYLLSNALFLNYRLKWDRKNTVILKASSFLQNRTCGLCGKFDGTILNDFETSDGSITDNVEGFVNSWTMENLGGRFKPELFKYYHSLTLQLLNFIVVSNGKHSLQCNSLTRSVLYQSPVTDTELSVLDHVSHR